MTHSHVQSTHKKIAAYLHGAYGGGDPEQGKEPDLPTTELPHLVENVVVVEHAAELETGLSSE